MSVQSSSRGDRLVNEKEIERCVNVQVSKYTYACMWRRILGWQIRSLCPSISSSQATKSQRVKDIIQVSTETTLYLGWSFINESGIRELVKSEEKLDSGSSH